MTDLIQKNSKEIEKMFQNNKTDEVSEDLSVMNLKTAAEMFIYLNYCPPKILSFYKDLFEKKAPKDIIHALTSLLDTSFNAGKESTMKISTRVSKYFDFIDTIE